ncbi:hypothetical protein BCR36DRAFT_585534, partial [Piromyces finnis]
MYINNEKKISSDEQNITNKLTKKQWQWPNWQQPQQNGWQPQQDSWQPQQNGWQPQQDSWQPQQNGWQPQQDGWQPQQNGWPQPPADWGVPNWPPQNNNNNNNDKKTTTKAKPKTTSKSSSKTKTTATSTINPTNATNNPNPIIAMDVTENNTNTNNDKMQYAQNNAVATTNQDNIDNKAGIDKEANVNTSDKNCNITVLSAGSWTGTTALVLSLISLFTLGALFIVHRKRSNGIMSDDMINFNNIAPLNGQTEDPNRDVLNEYEYSDSSISTIKGEGMSTVNINSTETISPIMAPDNGHEVINTLHDIIFDMSNENEISYNNDVLSVSQDMYIETAQSYIIN